MKAQLHRYLETNAGTATGDEGNAPLDKIGLERRRCCYHCWEGRLLAHQQHGEFWYTSGLDLPTRSTVGKTDRCAIVPVLVLPCHGGDPSASHRLLIVVA